MILMLRLLSCTLTLTLLASCSSTHGPGVEDGGPAADAGCVGAAPGPDCRCESGAWICESTCPAGINPWDPTTPANRCSVDGATCSSGSGPCGSAMFCTCESGLWSCAVAEPDPVCWCGREAAEGDPCTEEGALCGECCPSGTPSWPAMQCVAGSWRPAVCAPECPTVTPACPVETALAVGTFCGLDGQICGDPCCGTAITCTDGAWRPGPEAMCACTPGFICGPGECTSSQRCESYCGPDDGVLFRCVELPPACAECGCLPLEPWQSCAMIDGHIYVDGAVCG